MPRYKGGPAAGAQRGQRLPLWTLGGSSWGNQSTVTAGGLVLIVSPSWRAVGVFWRLRLACAHSVRLQIWSKIGVLGRFGPQKWRKMTYPQKKVSATNGPTMRSIAVFGPRMTLFQIFLQILYTHVRIWAHVHMRAENFSQNLSKSVS